MKKRHLKTLSDVIAVTLIFALTARCFAIEAQIDLKLVVPQDNLTLSPDDRAESAQKQISILILRVRPKVGAVRYGSIRLLLNGESVSRDMTVNGVDGGYDCVVDSGRGSSLPLHSGENLIEVSLTDTWNHVHKATFTIVLSARAA